MSNMVCIYVLKIHFNIEDNCLIIIVEWTVPQLSIMIIDNSTWSVLIQWIKVVLSGDNLT